MNYSLTLASIGNPVNLAALIQSLQDEVSISEALLKREMNFFKCSIREDDIPCHASSNQPLTI